MPDDDKQERRLSVDTILNTKTLTIWLPVILAIGSAFVMHDRAIHVLADKVKRHDDYIDNQSKSVTLQDLKSKVAVLEALANNRKTISVEMHNDIKELSNEIHALRDNVQSHYLEIRELNTRLKMLENRINSTN